MKLLKNHKLLVLVFLVSIVVLWQIVAIAMHSLLIPSPKDVVSAFVELFQDGYKGSSLGEHIYASLRRLFLAFLSVALFAIPLGLFSAFNKFVRALFEPLVEFLKPLPPLGYYSILILWFGIDELSKVLLLFFAGFAPLFIASYSAAHKIPQDFIHSAKNSGANAWQTFWRVIIPHSLPDIFTGIRISIGASYSALVAAEMVASQSGIGWIVLDSSKFMFIDIMFAGVIIIGLTGVCMDRIIVFIKSHFIHWEGKS
ncbi:ABC transporter permease [Helicobacter turcicus]|uniref:ABC transporter permease n=1 Tax=Helicobacter turcicus TaxID=2867412 RepID=A0ABS7JNK1_9HELI|nr:ABC transporter permease [Helicobacter turcicus]MBX7490991.1 ABC transporter permease [Helicobacter turcicus]MBX7545882.1 ABC transporter permease [Helicobacter turcicus]